jgi:hypothetical protein
MKASICKSTVLIMASLLFCSFDKVAWSQTPATAPQDETSGSTSPSPGAQLDYYQSVIEKMGREKVDSFSRFFVLPQTGHGLSGTSYSFDGEGKSIPPLPIPDSFSRLNLLTDWVEKNTAPPKSVTVTGGNRSLPMCSYPKYPKYIGGPADTASYYTCAVP